VNDRLIPSLVPENTSLEKRRDVAARRRDDILICTDESFIINAAILHIK